MNAELLSWTIEWDWTFEKPKRKNDIENQRKNLSEIKKKEKKKEIPVNKTQNKKIKRIKELENLKKMGIIKVDEFEKLKKDLID